MEDAHPSVSDLMDRLAALKPTSITVDAIGPGRMLLAAMQTAGLPARALEKRPRPSLPEVTRAEELSRTLDKMRHEMELKDQELRLLREHQKHLHTLIERLD